MSSQLWAWYISVGFYITSQHPWLQVNFSSKVLGGCIACTVGRLNKKFGNYLADVSYIPGLLLYSMAKSCTPKRHILSTNTMMTIKSESLACFPNQSPMCYIGSGSYYLLLLWYSSRVYSQWTDSARLSYAMHR